jgi:hypothetical protein
MTFEPIINMADAVRQPRPFLAETAAWLGVITADMPMQNWYVYNHIMYARWVLDDAVSAVNAKLLELTPSLMGPVTTIQPTITFVVKGGGEGEDDGTLLRAKAWRDTAFEAKHPGGEICVHLVVASIAERPSRFRLQLGGLCDSSSSGGGSGGGTAAAAAAAACREKLHNATHLCPRPPGAVKRP